MKFTIQYQLLQAFAAVLSISKRNNNHTLRYCCCYDQYGSSLANASGVFAFGSCSNSCVR